MTVIAYRNGVIACDTLACVGDSALGAVTKIARNSSGDLAAGAGLAGSVYRFLEWFKAGENGEHPELVEDPNNYDRCVIVRKSRPDEILVFEPKGTHTIRIDSVATGTYYAFGSGRPEALGAMFVGATAHDAVRAAIAHDVHCGGDVMVLTHD